MYDFIFQHLYIIVTGHCSTQASINDPSTVLGPAPGISDRILNHEV